jgi:polyferredoxin
MTAMNRAYLRYLRYAVQAAFLAITLLAGHQFYHFVLHFEAPGRPFVQRPPSVDAFLPIAGMMSFKYFLYTRIVEPVHPAALVMFTSIVIVSLLFKKGFCGWICPISSVSQYLWMAGKKVFGRNFVMRKYADISLRSIKYILMSFFILIIWVRTPVPALKEFFLSDYYKIADVKTMKFFTGMSSATFWFLTAVGVLSLLYENFWCRYLCPYGALLGLLSRMSPVKVRRIENKCSHCHACSRHCPAHLDVEHDLREPVSFQGGPRCITGGRDDTKTVSAVSLCSGARPSLLSYYRRRNNGGEMAFRHPARGI